MENKCKSAPHPRRLAACWLKRGFHSLGWIRLSLPRMRRFQPMGKFKLHTPANRLCYLKNRSHSKPIINNHRMSNSINRKFCKRVNPVYQSAECESFIKMEKKCRGKLNPKRLRKNRKIKLSGSAQRL